MLRKVVEVKAGNKKVKVLVEIDEDAVAQEMAEKAYSNKSKEAKALSGAIAVSVVPKVKKEDEK